jgi:hypothetical protein
VLLRRPSFERALGQCGTTDNKRRPGKSGGIYRLTKLVMTFSRPSITDR